MMKIKTFGRFFFKLYVILKFILVSQNGVFKCMEKLAGRPMQRVVCMLHHVELPMRALFLYYDGPKSGKLLNGRALLLYPDSISIKMFWKVILFIMPDS